MKHTPTGEGPSLETTIERSEDVRPFAGEGLIFLISQPRAGSTLLQHLLAGNPQVHTAPEPWVMLPVVYSLKGEGFSAEYDARMAGIAMAEFSERLAAGESVYLDAARAWAKVVYQRALAGSGKHIFLDKTPRYYYIIPELYRLFPRAHFIFLLRNPLAVLSSILHTWVKDDLPLLVHYRDDLLTAPGRLLQGLQILGNAAHIVRYEELVQTPVETLTKLCAELGLDYSPAMLAYGGRMLGASRLGDDTGLPAATQVVTRSLEKWRSLADDDQSRHFAQAYLAAVGRQTVVELGYDYNALLEAVSQTAGVESWRSPLVPWEIVLKPADEWERAEFLRYHRARSLSQDGFWLGMWRFVSRHYRTLLRAALPF